MKRQPAVIIHLELRQHGRVQQVAIDRIGDEQARRLVVEGQRPERVGGWQLAILEA
jgi:hypothetical protein